MNRINQRAATQMRTTHITPSVMPNAEGSCLVEMGSTRVLCTASVENKTPAFTKGLGWITAEYALLPRATLRRTPRETPKFPNPRNLEVQRLIARSLRTVLELPVLGNRTIWVDCDVLQSDGSAHCAAITGSYVAVAQLCRELVKEALIHRLPLAGSVAAVSIGVSSEGEMLDLTADEECQCQSVFSIVGTDKRKLVEVQASSGQVGFDRISLNRVLSMAQSSLDYLFELQKHAIE